MHPQAWHESKFESMAMFPRVTVFITAKGQRQVWELCQARQLSGLSGDSGTPILARKGFWWCGVSFVALAEYLTNRLEGGKAYVESGLRECGP